LDQWVTSALEAGLSHVVCVATSIQMGLDSLAISKQYPQLLPTIGIHPCEAGNPDRLDELATLVQNNRFYAIGEIGLDFYRDNAPLEQQMTVFLTQFEVARQFGLPVIIHTRNADEQMAPVINQFPDVKKVVHCFSSSLDFAQKVASDTTYFSFTGMVTYPNKKAVLEVIDALPLDKMMIETDCPYLTPVAFKGQENEPAFVGEVAKVIAQVKGCSLEEVIDVTTRNALSFFEV
jgi:TatD DNase family protein